MLTIRLQRGGRTGHAQFRVIVQDSRAHPTSGRVVAYVGSYNPHTKSASLNKEKIETYLGNGAVPSDRVAKLLTKEGIKLPSWYKASPAKEKTVRNPEKRRSTRPEGVPEPESPAAENTDEAAPTEAESVESKEAGSEAETQADTEKPTEDSIEAQAEEPKEEPAPAEVPAEETPAEPVPAEDKPAE